MELLRTALVYPGYPPEESLGGGISTYAQEAAEGLSRHGHSVTVFSRTELFKEEVCLDKNIRILRIPSETAEALNNAELIFRNRGAFSYSERVRGIIKRLEQKEGPFDVVEVGDWGAEAIALLPEYKHKLVIRCHTPSFVSESYNPLNPPYLSEYVKSLEKRVLQETLFIASPSQSLIEEIQTHIHLTANITIQPYPLSIDNVPYKQIYQTEFNAQRPLRVVVCGRLEQRKGQDIVSQAIQELWQEGYNIEVTFVGADTPLSTGESYRRNLLQIINPEFHDHIRFLGHTSRAQIPNIYPQHDLYISASRFESLGFVVLEAMRAGLPVIASRVCEMSRLIQHEVTGYLFNNENIKELSFWIKHLLLHPPKIQEMGIAGRKKIINEYGDDKSIRKMIEHYKSIIMQYETRNR